MPFYDFAAAYLGARDGEVRMNQISPKIFEAIRLRTALVLFEGDYSGVIERDRHYIPLAQDFSNIEEVFAKLQDLGYIQTLTDRAYREIIEGGRFSYRAFAEGVDEQLDGYGLGRARARIHSVPILAIYDEDDIEALWQWTVPPAAVGNVIIDRQMREWVRKMPVPIGITAPAIAAIGPKGVSFAKTLLARLRKALKKRVKSMPWLVRCIRRLRGVRS